MAPSDFLDHIDELIERDNLQFAFNILCAIRKTVSDQQRVSIAQIQAVENIVRGTQKEPRHEGGEDLPTSRLNDGFHKRRYEGS